LLRAHLKDGNDGPEKGVEILAAAFAATGHHLAAVALAMTVRLQRAELPAKQIHPENAATHECKTVHSTR